jgi:mRNA export factor
MSGLFGSASSAATNTVGDLKGDVEVANPPTDSISDIAFNPNPNDQKDFLTVSSWDKKVRIYEILQNGTAEGRHMYEHDQPILSCDFAPVSFLPSTMRLHLR